MFTTTLLAIHLEFSQAGHGLCWHLAMERTRVALGAEHLMCMCTEPHTCRYTSDRKPLVLSDRASAG